MKTSFFKGLLVGLAAGAVAGVLMAPKAGKETREDIREAANEWSTKFSKKINRLKNIGKSQIDNTFDSVMASYEKLDLTEAQKEEIKDEISESFARIKDIVNEG